MKTQEVRARYMTGFEQRLMSIYRQAAAGIEPNAKERDLFNGYMDAGLVTGLVTKDELQALIDQRHQSMFGMTIAERRRLQKKPPGLDFDAEDYAFYEVPTWMRKGIRL